MFSEDNISNSKRFFTFIKSRKKETSGVASLSKKGSFIEIQKPKIIYLMISFPYCSRKKTSQTYFRYPTVFTRLFQTSKSN